MWRAMIRWILKISKSGKVECWTNIVSRKYDMLSKTCGKLNVIKHGGSYER